jgi:hypothetical protein
MILMLRAGSRVPFNPKLQGHIHQLLIKTISYTLVLLKLQNSLSGSMPVCRQFSRLQIRYYLIGIFATDFNFFLKVYQRAAVSNLPVI